MTKKYVVRHHNEKGYALFELDEKLAHWFRVGRWYKTEGSLIHYALEPRGLLLTEEVSKTTNTYTSYICKPI